MNIGLTQHAIGQHRDAADSLASGIAGLPDDQQNAEWTAKYRDALDRARAEVDEPVDGAVGSRNDPGYPYG